MNKLIFSLIGVFLILNLAKGQDNFKIGNEEFLKGNYAKAIEYYSLDIDKSPSYSAYYNRGSAYSNLEKFNDAISDFTQAIKLEPDSAKAYYQRGCTYDNLKRYNESVKDYTEAIQLNPDFDSYCNRGYAYIHLKKYTEAISDYTKANELKPYNAGPYYCLGYTYLELKDYSKAEINQKKCLELDPKCFQAMINLSLLYYEKQNYDDSKKWMINAFGVDVRLSRGIEAIKLFENDGSLYYSDDKNDELEKIFDMLND